MKCDRCGYPGIYHPVKPVVVGHSRGRPVVQYLCGVCAANHLRRAKEIRGEASRNGE